MSPSPSVIIAKVSTSLLFHTAHFAPVFVLCHELADSTTLRVPGSTNVASAAFSGVCMPRSYALRGRLYALCVVARALRPDPTPHLP